VTPEQRYANALMVNAVAPEFIAGRAITSAENYERLLRLAITYCGVS